MKLFLWDHSKKYKAENIVRLFFPDAELCHGRRKGEDYIYIRYSAKKAVVAVNRFGDLTFSYDKYDNIEMFLYTFFKKYTGMKPPFGMLCGVRPLWMYRKRIELGLTSKQTIEELKRDFDISDEKALLLKKCYETQQKMDLHCPSNSYSLYISIPYCPSRCRYCSFISMASNSKKEMQCYLDLLIKELRLIAEKNKNKLLQTIYIGGGTPTVISAPQLQELLDVVIELFPNRREFTVEAGRPDCTDREKLRIMKVAGVDRISINPQTFRDDVLRGIGRNHTSEDILRCYNEAVCEGHDNINMDLIAGLPGDTAEGFAESLVKTIALNPAGITVHCFTKKSGSMLSGGDFTANPELFEMMRIRDELLTGYNPYYIYRQKKTPANLENVGYAKGGYECLYNVYMMDELHTVISAGAGGVTKMVEPNRSSIVREFHPKYPTQYIELMNDMLNLSK